MPPPEIQGTSGEYLSRSGVSTFACSETQKFGHVTFFWNGNRSGYFDAKLETYLEVRRTCGDAFLPKRSGSGNSKSVGKKQTLHGMPSGGV